MSDRISYPQAADVWAVLADECGLSTNERDFADFSYHWPACREYRFQGSLGFGGKVWADDGRVYVTCYRKDETPELRVMIDRANRRLAGFSSVVTP